MSGATYTVNYTPLDALGEHESHFDGPEALRAACLFAQGVEEDGGSAIVIDGDGGVVDHWEGYRVALVPNGTDDSVGLALGVELTRPTNHTS